MNLKTIGIIILSLFITNICHAQYNPDQGTNSNKEEVSDFHIGAGLGYGTSPEAVGLQIGTLYRVTKNISLTGDVLFFFPENYSWTEVNINAHYNFVTSETAFVYALTGFNNTSISFDTQYRDFSHSNTGLNLGAGSQFNLGVINLYTELKTILNDNSGLTLTAGLRYGF